MKDVSWVLASGLAEGGFLGRRLTSLQGANSTTSIANYIAVNISFSQTSLT